MIEFPKVEAYICPRCFRVSRNLADIENNYCGSCHEFISQSELAVLEGYMEVVNSRLNALFRSKEWSPIFCAEVEATVGRLFHTLVVNYLGKLSIAMDHPQFKFLMTHGPAIRHHRLIFEEKMGPIICLVEKWYSASRIKCN